MTARRCACPNGLGKNLKSSGASCLHVYRDSDAKQEEGKAKHLVEQLYLYYLQHLHELPEEFTKNIPEDGAERVAADYIACMTDRYAITDYERKFIPREWMQT